MDLYYRIDSKPATTITIIGLWEDQELGRGVAGGTGGSVPLLIAFVRTLGLAAGYICALENANRMMDRVFHERKL